MLLHPQSDCDCAPPQGDALLAEGPRMMVAEVVPVWQRQDQVLTQLLDAVDITHQRREQLLAQLAESLVQLDAIESDLRDTLPEDALPLQRLDDSRSALALLSQQVAADTRSDHARQDQALTQARQSLVELAVARGEPEIASCALQSLSACHHGLPGAPSQGGSVEFF